MGNVIHDGETQNMQTNEEGEWKTKSMKDWKFQHLLSDKRDFTDTQIFGYGLRVQGWQNWNSVRFGPRWGFMASRLFRHWPKWLKIAIFRHKLQLFTTIQKR